ncbi:hypothetical protein AB0M87_07185 [Streptomyces sp. NPDC051320]|uniref:hypothetical protein n=1 Tax=Streptomyces sp. NPDC051320 TaxID=3154644 RepID=UPI003415B270
MPRPTAAQLAYGSATVVFSTLAMLLLSRTTSGVGVAVIVLAAWILGLLVAMTVPMPRAARAAEAGVRNGAAQDSAGRAAVSVPASAPAAVRVTAPTGRADRVGGHSLRS